MTIQVIIHFSLSSLLWVMGFREQTDVTAMGCGFQGAGDVPVVGCREQTVMFPLSVSGSRQ